MNKYLDPKRYIIYICLRLSKLVARWQKGKIEKYGSRSLKHQPIFIIGAPRTGSTILYQLLTNELDVLYIDNLTCIFQENLFFGFWLSKKLFKQRAHNSFNSKYGNTLKSGLRAPSECGGFWYKWLPKNKHFIDYDDISDEMVREIRNEITSVINYFDKPLIFKNLNAGQRIRLLKKCFPEAKFIFIKRDPIFTAQSILKAKRKIGIKDNSYWGIMAPNFNELEKLKGHEQIVKQIFYIEKQITKDQKLYSLENILKINYADLGKEFESTLRTCKDFIKSGCRDDFEKKEIVLSEKKTLSNYDFDKLRTEIDRLDWVNYCDK